MRAFRHFLAAIAVALLIASLLAYPAYQLIHPWQPEWRLDKIASRLFDLLLLGFIILVLNRLRLQGREAWGWQTPLGLGARQYLVGVVLGILTMSCVSLSMVLLGARPLNPALDAAMLRTALVAGLGSGLVVGFVEETLFRGLILGAATRDSRSPWPGLISVSLLFASLHFLANVKIAHADVTPWSGLLLLTSTFADFMHPERLVDAFLALAGVGLLTGLARLTTGNVLFAAGLHGGWVLVMRTTIGITQLPKDAANAWLLSDHDGYTGWLVTFFILLFLAVGKLSLRPLRALLRVA